MDITPRMLKKIELADYPKEEDNPLYKNLSDEAKDLISQMICSDPSRRIKINEVKNHKWFKRMELEKELKNPIVLENHWDINYPRVENHPDPVAVNTKMESFLGRMREPEKKP